MADETQEKPMKDNAFVMEFMTVYLHGLYALKGGRLSPAESIKQLLAFSNMAEKMSGMGKDFLKLLGMRGNHGR